MLLIYKMSFVVPVIGRSSKRLQTIERWWPKRCHRVRRLFHPV